MRQAEHRRTVEIFIVHHVVERKSVIGARRGQDLEECAVNIVVGIGIAAAKGIAGAEPGIDQAHLRLPAGFTNKRSGALRYHAPAAALQSSPKLEVELARAIRAENMGIVGAVRGDADVEIVGGPGSDSPIVGLEDRPAFTHSLDSKKNAGSLRVFALGYVGDRGAGAEE